MKIVRKELPRQAPFAFFAESPVKPNRIKQTFISGDSGREFSVVRRNDLRRPLWRSVP